MQDLVEDGSRSVALVPVQLLDRTDESVAVPGERLDEKRRPDLVTERAPQAVHGVVQAVIEVDERVVRPEPPPQFLSRDHGARMLEEHREDPERLFREPHPQALLAQLVRSNVDLEATETEIQAHGRSPDDRACPPVYPH